MFTGIDVSEWQGIIDWNRVKTDFAIIRAGYGNDAAQTDKYFSANYKGCTANNIPCGAYWYSYAESPEDAELEAEACISVLGGRKFSYPIFYDVEEQSILSQGRSAVSAIVRAFLDKMEKSGYFVGLYMSADSLISYTEADIQQKYTIWVADYDVPKPTYSGNYGIWQKSESGTVSGIYGNVDTDESFNDYPTIIRNAGLNNFGKPHRISVIIDGKTIIDDYRF